MSDIIESVKEYYGKTIHSINDLQSGACCTETPSAEVRSALYLIANEIKEKFYGCGSPLPQLLRRMTVLDLGCGTGRDVYVASRMVGENGHVIGVDMTTEQIEIAQKYQDEQRERFGYGKSNVTFKQGYIEDLKSLGIEDNSIDVVISNCVINLSTNREQVFREIYRVLKPGGELYFSDVFADRRMTASNSTEHPDMFLTAVRGHGSNWSVLVRVLFFWLALISSSSATKKSPCRFMAMGDSFCILGLNLNYVAKALKPPRIALRISSSIKASTK
jgi:SAM-dependent methyltransferase